MFTIEHSMVQWNSKSWTFQVQPFSGQIYQRKIVFQFSKCNSCLINPQSRKMIKVYHHFTLFYSFFLNHGMQCGNHFAFSSRAKLCIFHWLIWPEYGWILKVHDLLFHCTIEYSMVNIGEGNLYVTCIKGFVSNWIFLHSLIWRNFFGSD